MQKAIFLDKDGTLLTNVPYNTKPELVELTPRSVEGLRTMKDLGFLIVMVTNQSGIARGIISEADFQSHRAFVDARLKREGVAPDAWYYCPHHPEGKVPQYSRSCTCRKPGTGMLEQARDELFLDMTASWMIGDILDDVETGNRMGVSTILLNTGGETMWEVTETRIPDYFADDLAQASAIIYLHTRFPEFIGERRQYGHA